MNFFGFSVGDWASVLGILGLGASFIGWLFNHSMNKLNSVIDSHMNNSRQDSLRNIELVKQSNQNQEKLSVSIDKLRQSIEEQRYEMLEKFGKHDVELAKHDSRITALEYLEGLEKHKGEN